MQLYTFVAPNRMKMCGPSRIMELQRFLTVFICMDDARVKRAPVDLGDFGPNIFG